jgi:hypothetical protein
MTAKNRGALPALLRLGTQLALPLWAELHPVKAKALANRIEPGWQRRSACIDATDPDAWFPPEKARRTQLVVPLTTCASCPVRRSCLAAGMRSGEAGIWGGTTEQEREAARAVLNAGGRTDDVLGQLLALPAEPSRRGVA